MFPCCKKKPEVTKQFHSDPIKTIGDKDNFPIALVVGHNEKSQGAENYLGETEFVFNSRIALKVQNALNDLKVPSVIIKRPPIRNYKIQCEAVSERVHKYGCAISLHLHFNSFTEEVFGCEILVLEGLDNNGEEAADFITDQLNFELDIKQRAVDGVSFISNYHNGYGMLKAVYDVGCIPLLIEPCFANIRTKESIQIFENEDAYVKVLAYSLADLVKE